MRLRALEPGARRDRLPVALTTGVPATDTVTADYELPGVEAALRFLSRLILLRG